MVIIIKKTSASTPCALPPTPTSNAKITQLSELIEKCIECEPFEHSGYIWAKRPQNLWKADLSWSVETLRRVISKPPFVRERIVDPTTGNQITLIRVGMVGPKTKKHVQNILSKIWRTKTGRDIVGVQFGHLGGLVDEWGLDNAPEILKLVLNDVPAFMAGANIKIAELGDDGYRRYFKKFPPTSFVLRFNMVGKEMLLMKNQASHASQAAKSDWSAFVPF